MISINHNTKDKHALCGMKHFIEKYGLVIDFNNKESQVKIVYGNDSSLQNESMKKFIIVIKENEDGKSPIKLSALEDLSRNPDIHKSKYVSRKNDKIIVDIDIFKITGYLVSGEMERMWKFMKPDNKRKISEIPFLDFYENILFESIIFACRKMNIPLVQKDFWPEGKKFAVCLTHDVDEIKKTYQYVTKPIRLAKNRDLSGIIGQLASMKHKIKGKEPYWTFEELIEIEKKLGVRSTFFFLKETANVKLMKPKTWKHHGRRYEFKHDKISEMIKKLQAGGWEIGLHGSFDSYNDIEKLKNEKNELEDVLEEKIKGSRQHNLRLEIPNTWHLHENIGLEYDTSLGHSNFIGFRWGTSFPFSPFNPTDMKEIDILEIPLIVMDITLFSLNKSREALLSLQKEVEIYSGLLTLLWHHTVFNNHEFPKWGNVYEEIIRICSGKMAWITTARDITEWWRKRESNKISYKFSGNKIYIKADENQYLKIHIPPKKRARLTSNNATIINEEKNSLTLKSDGSETEVLIV